MQIGYFLVLVVAALVTSCEIASAFNDVTPTKATSSSLELNSVKVLDNGGRSLRSGKTDEDDGEARANGWYEKMAAYLANLTKGKSKKQAADLTRTFPSPPTADKLTRSKSFPAEKAAAEKLTRSKSLVNTKDYTFDDVERLMTKHTKEYQMMDKMKKTPDDLVRFYNLDTELLAKADDVQLRAAAKGDNDKIGQQELWYGYMQFYKEKHPGWYSSLVKENFI